MTPMYCEATSWLGMAQPWNVLSNVIFLFLALRLWRETSAKWHRYGLILIALASVVWHTTQISWLLWFEVAAIVIWTFLYALDVSRCLKHPPHRYLSLAIVFWVVSVTVAFSLLSALPMFSGIYIPFLVLMLTLSATWPDDSAVRRAFLIGAAAMFVAVIVREIDMVACSVMPMGTHWLWQILAAFSLVGPIYVLVRFCEKNQVK